jgi:2-dehydropantoate 2-reductase
LDAEGNLLMGKIALVGTGAIGGYYGGFLARAGAEVHFLFRSDYQVAKKNGLRITMRRDATESFQLNPVRSYCNPEEIGICDWVIVAVKTTANEMLPEILGPLIGERTQLLTLQNGMGNVEWLSKVFGAHRSTIAGLCFTCCNRVAPCEVENYFPGYVQFGELGRRLSTEGRSVMNAFSQSGIQTKEATTLEDALWRKLCWNVPFSGLAVTAGGITTDRILDDSELSARARSLMVEIQTAARACEVEIEDDFLDQQFDLTKPMGEYKPSSLVDFLAGSEIEVEAIWGEPLRRGKMVGVPMPELDKLYHDLLSLT